MNNFVLVLSVFCVYYCTIVKQVGLNDDNDDYEDEVTLICNTGFKAIAKKFMFAR